MALGNVDLNRYQDGFMFSQRRFPAIISAVGTGKTMALLLKAWSHCEENPGALALLVRREYTDLRDSTIQDFTAYFGVNISSQNKDYEFPNGSKIMFRHGDLADINVLKNINLSFVGIEQAEEYETADVFDFLRDRLRRKIKGLRQMVLIANARGHNWIWDRWVNKAEEVDTIDIDTGQYVYKNGPYECYTANSFANAHNLPEDFIEDLKQKAHDAPNQFAQFVMNSFDAVDEDDFLVTQEDIDKSLKIEYVFNHPQPTRVLGVDVARYGADQSVGVLLRSCGPVHWDVEHVETWKGKDMMETTGRIIDLKMRYKPDLTSIDGDGLGVGAVDRIKELGHDVIEFRGGMVEGIDKNRYTNRKAQGYFLVKEMMQDSKLRCRNEMVNKSLRTVKYKFMSNGRRAIVTKEEMKKKGLKSPDEADALMIAIDATTRLGSIKKTNNSFVRGPQYAIMNSGPVSLGTMYKSNRDKGNRNVITF